MDCHRENPTPIGTTADSVEGGLGKNLWTLARTILNGPALHWGDAMEGPPIHISRLPVFTNWNPRCRQCGNTYRIRVHYDRVCWAVIGGVNQRIMGG